MLAPIAIFAYNRPLHLQKTIESLQKNSLAPKSDVWIYSDAPKTSKDTLLVTKVREYLYQVKGFKNIFIIERKENLGLAKSIISGVTEVLEQYQKIIVLEDDMICTTNFLNFMNDSLNFYENNSHIFSISGYSFPIKIPQNYELDVYLGKRASSWGWATWQKKWKKTDWEVLDFKDFMKNKKERKNFNEGGDDLSLMLYKQQKNLISSWAVRWCYTHYKHNAYCLYPIFSKIQNIGADNSGTHTPKTDKFDVNLEEKEYKLSANIVPNILILKELKKFFHQNWWKKIKNLIKYGILNSF